MITQLLNHPRMISQNSEDGLVIESPIGVSIDNGGTIVLEQDGNSICVHTGSVKDLVKVLRELERLADDSE